ncbi:hypothetical protein OJF2_15990 [Aquisphaera giovannonii]|uniref:Double zinc ribbon n=1 Tax=Aquisphaera giovannonii TaxID=406548 RepID=A0A5B9VXT9_9BACT|nr:hypothetical protein [Aquisphaera giovannonii]QEH33102.1 hypothetical protein OJF2_15990 [Aquisphaera giovannonii]
MIDCAYCERPLLCDGCGTPFVPSSPEEYQALSWRDTPIRCPGCGMLLVCRWCKSPYDGRDGQPEGEDGDPTS